MRRNFLFILALFATTVGVSMLQKPIFLLWYSSLADGASLGELCAVVWHGALLDLTVAGYVTALPVLLTIAAVWFPHRVWRRVVQWYLVVAATVLSVAFSVNMALYEYWAFPLDASLLQFLATPKEAMASVTPWQFMLYFALAVGCFAVVWLCYRAVLRLFAPEARVRISVRGLSTLLLVLLAGFDFLAIRGGVTTAVANVSMVYFSDRIFLNHAAVNPTFSFLSSLSNGERLDLYDFEPEQTCAERFEALCRVDESLPLTDSLLASARPNIVLILAESFGRSTSDAVVDGEAVAPHFQQLKSEGVWFENLISSSFRTDRGVLATLSGFPAQPTMSLMKDPVKCRNVASIASSLAEVGYSTSYVHGGDLNFTNMAAYLYGTGFEQLVAFKDMSFDAPTSKWGYADDVVADYFIDFVAEKAAADRPYLAVWQTLSSHEPFDVPTKRFDDAMLNSMAFADEQIARVVDALRASAEWDNTLLIIIADHAYPYPYGVAASDAARYRIPMLWLGGALRHSATVETFASQSDLAATLLAQLGLPTGDFPLSRNIFTSSPHFGYYTYNNGFGVVDAEGTTTYDCTSARIVSPSKSERAEQVGRTMLQTTYKIIKQL